MFSPDPQVKNSKNHKTTKKFGNKLYIFVGSAQCSSLQQLGDCELAGSCRKLLVVAG
jgi:hypothetical protein